MGSGEGSSGLAAVPSPRCRPERRDAVSPGRAAAAAELPPRERGVGSSSGNQPRCHSRPIPPPTSSLTKT